MARSPRQSGLGRAYTSDQGLQQFLDTVSEVLETGLGLRPHQDQRARFLTVGDLEQLGLATVARNGLLTMPGGRGDQPRPAGRDTPDLAQPPVPTGLQARGAIDAVILSWDNPYQLYRNHAFTEIWRADINDLGRAVLVHRSPSFTWVDVLGQPQPATRYYWIRFVSAAGVIGPFNGLNGVAGTTSGDPAYLLELLSGEIRETQLSEELRSRIDVIDAPETGLSDRVTQLDAALEQTSQALQSARQEIDDAIASTNQALQDAEGRLSAAISTTSQALADAEDRLDAAITAANQALLDAELRLDGTEGAILSTTQRIELAEDRLTAAETLISQHDAQIQLRATKTELAEAVAAILEGFTPAASFQFNGTTEGWTATNATLTAGESTVTLTATGVAPSMQHTGLSVVGDDYPLILLRVRRLAGTGWAGTIRYSTDEHGFGNEYRKVIPQPINWTDWTTIQVNMRDLTAGGDDWTTSTITGLQLQLGAGPGDAFEIDFIEIGKSSIEQFLFEDLSARLQQAEIDIDANRAAIQLKADQVVVQDHAARLQQAQIELDAMQAAIALKASQAEVDALGTRLGQAEVQIDAAVAAIALKASQVEVSDLANRLGEAELSLDAAHAAIALKASQVDVDAFGERLGQVELGLDAANQAIALKASQAALDNLVQRLDSAEMVIDGTAGAIGMQARSLTDLRAANEDAAEALLEELVRQDEAMNAARIHGVRLAAAEQILQAHSDELQAEAAARLALAARVDDTVAGLAEERIARATADEAFSKRADALATRLENTEAGLLNEVQARASGDQALSQQLLALSATVGNHSSLIQQNAQAIATEAGARAQVVQQLQAQLADQAAAIQTKASIDALTTAQGQIEGLRAQYTVKLDVNGHVAGFGLAAEPTEAGPSSVFLVSASRFAVGHPGAESVYPFIVDDGVVYLDEARIRAGAIKSFQLGTGAIQSAHIGEAVIQRTHIAEGQITMAHVDQFLASTNYQAGVSGWILHKDGTAEFRNGYFRGDVYSENAYIRGNVEADRLRVNAANIVSTLHLQGQAVTIPVSAFTATQLQLSADMMDVQVAVIQSSGAPIMLIGGFSWRIYASGPPGDVVWARVHVTRDGQTVWGPQPIVSSRIPGGDPGSTGIFDQSGITTISLQDQPGVGLHTYRLIVSTSPNARIGSNSSVTSRSILLLETKR